VRCIPSKSHCKFARVYCSKKWTHFKFHMQICAAYCACARLMNFGPRGVVFQVFLELPRSCAAALPSDQTKLVTLSPALCAGFAVRLR